MPHDGALSLIRSRISTAALKARLVKQANSTGPKPRRRLTRAELALEQRNRREWLADYSTRLGHAMQVNACDLFSNE
jgi:hypothetical protein